MNPLLEVTGITKQFGCKTVLKEISFKLYPGEILGIIGPNGAGKSTLLYILLGIITPDRGQIFYFGESLSERRSAILREVGFASHYVSLPYSLTVWENLKVFCHLYGVKDSNNRIRELLKLFRLETKEKALTRTLSSGEMMRLNLIRAFLAKPKVLLLDEPTAGLDPEYVKYVGKILKEEAETKGLSIILTSHQLGELEKMINKILLLKEGNLLSYGKTEEVFKQFGVTNLEELYFKVFGHALT